MNTDEIVGEFLLLSDGLAIHNPEYVKVYGRYIGFLRRLPYRPISDEKRKHLTELYSREAESARFWATYPEDVSKLTAKQKRLIFIKCHPKI